MVVRACSRVGGRVVRGAVRFDDAVTFPGFGQKRGGGHADVASGLHWNGAVER